MFNIEKLNITEIEEINIDSKVVFYLTKIYDMKDRNVLLFTKKKLNKYFIIDILNKNKDKILEHYNFSLDFFDNLKIDVFQLLEIDNITINKKIKINDEKKIKSILDKFCNYKFKYLANYFDSLTEPFILINETDYELKKLKKLFISLKKTYLYQSNKIRTINNEIKELKKIINKLNKLDENNDLFEVFDKEFLDKLDKKFSVLIENIKI